MTTCNITEVKEFKAEADHQEILSWWKAQDWPGLPAAMLPFGFVSWEDGVRTAAAFVIGTDGALHVMEWIVGNPQVNYEARGRGVEAVVKACLAHCKEQGALVVITTTKHQRLIDRYKEMGFQETDSGMTHLVVTL